MTRIAVTLMVLALGLLAACTPPQGKGFSGIGGEPKIDGEA
ncbi:MAG: hypothetical protein AAGF79_09405 [Pseudomonadota bacterium]